MRFYQNKQLEMLTRTALWLDKQKETVSRKVPALNNLIPEFKEKQAFLYKLMIADPKSVRMGTSEKGTTRAAFTKVLEELLAVLKAAHFKNKTKPIAEINISSTDLHKLSAGKLCDLGIRVIRATSKVSNLNYYGLSAGDIKEARGYYKEFKAVKEMPGDMKAERKKNNLVLVAGIKEAIQMLKDAIDPLMRIATKDDFHLQREYKTMRIVLRRKVGRPSEAEKGYRKSREKKKE